MWGWHLGLRPSSHAGGLAYANGVESFGAQPLRRPEDGFTSYVYTDRGRDYVSHAWDGRRLTVHANAMRVDGGLEALLVERRVGLLEELSVRHILARGRNPREKPVERVHRDVSDWERNTFPEYCGRSPAHRPDRWRQLYAAYERLASQCRANESPFLSFDIYRERLAEWIVRYNATPHERHTLGGGRFVPLDEYTRLYTTRYEIRSETLALLLMRAEQRQVRKNGVQCFQRHWFYYHEALSAVKGCTVEVRYADDDFSRVWVVLPDARICEATLVTPTPLLNPDRRTLEMVAEMRAADRRVIRDYTLVAEARARGESEEVRVARIVDERSPITASEPAPSEPPVAPVGHITPLTRLDRPKLRGAAETKTARATPDEAIEVDATIFDATRHTRVRLDEFEDDEEGLWGTTIPS